MARRRTLAEPTSRLAILSRRLALFAVVVVVLTVVIARVWDLEFVVTLAALGSVLALAVVAILLALAAFVVIWNHGVPGFGHALTAVFVGLALLAYPAYLGIRGYGLPRISDVTTDVLDPPRFDVIARLRSRDTNPAAYAGLRAAELQREAYPAIEPLYLNARPQQAYDAAYAMISRRKWRIVDQRAPQPGRRDGRIEAVARTPIMGFRDDVVVRVRADQDGARVDMRSASRYGRFDFGANAARVRALLDDIEENVETDEPEKPAKAVKKEKKGAKPAQPAKR